MNYLQLSQRLRQEAGLSGSGPTTVVAQTGQSLKMVSWINTAWEEIQLMRPNWLFMNAEFTLATVAGQRDINPVDQAITDLKLWDRESFLIYDPTIGESDQNALIYLSYGNWREGYRSRMNDRPNQRPQKITILPTNYVRFEPRPDAIYTIEGEYKRSTQVFTLDADVPTNLPDDFHMIIVWKALMYYGFYENAPEVLDEAEFNFDNLLFRLEQEQLPEMSTEFETLV